MQFAKFEAPEVGDRFIPKENIGHLIVVRVNGVKTGVVTSNSPDGTSAIEADLVDLDGPDQPVYRDTLLFGGSFVDALRNYVGQLVVVRIEQRTSKANRQYAAPVEVGEAETARAQELFAKGDPFAPTVTTTGGDAGPAPASAKPPF